MSDQGGQAPRAFVSHASEDKDRFVLPFATALLAGGVDAWVDQWEMGPGDSLVQRIFEEGIAQADAFIVVLSPISVAKPWVREELDAGVVRRITTGRATRLIPIVLDDEVEVPAALRHLLWESVPKDGFDAVVRRVIDQLHGHSRKPTLGSRPAYTTTSLRWTTTAADETVFGLLVDELRAHDGPGWRLFSDKVRDRAAAAGIDQDQFVESMHALIEAGLVKVTVMAGGSRFSLHPFPDRVWLQLQQDAGIDIAALRRQALAAIVNENRKRLTEQDFDAGFHTLGGILRSLQGEGLITMSVRASGEFVISRVSPIARRALKD